MAKTETATVRCANSVCFGFFQLIRTQRKQMASSTTTRTIVLTYLAGDCGGLFLLSCCRQKQIETLSNIKFKANRVELQTEIVQDKKTNAENQHNQTPTGTYPTITCDEVGLSVSGVLLSLYALGKSSFISLSIFILFIFVVVTTVIR